MQCNRFWLVRLVGCFSLLSGGESFSVGLVDQLFQPASNQVETAENMPLDTGSPHIRLEYE